MKSGDREAFREYVASRSPALMRTAFLLTGDAGEAEDLLQEALARLSQSWVKVRERDALDAYTRRTMVNLRSSYRRRRRVESFSVAEPPAGRAPGHDLATTVVAREQMWAALATLPPRMRAVIVLRYYEDLTEVETAAAMGCSVGNVKSQTSRALTKLRALTTMEVCHAD